MIASPRVARKARRDRDVALAKAFAHPLRFEILTIARRCALSPREFAQGHEVSPEGAGYHFKRLVELGALEPACSAQPKVEADRTYRATHRAAIAGSALQGSPWVPTHKMLLALLQAGGRGR